MAVISHSALKAAFRFGVCCGNTNHQLWKASDIVVITRCLNNNLQAELLFTEIIFIFQLYKSCKPVVLNIKSYYRLLWITEKRACFLSTLSLLSCSKGMLLFTTIYAMMMMPMDL